MDHPTPESRLELLQTESGMLDLVPVLFRHGLLLLLAPVFVGAVALGVTYLMTPVYTATTSFLPPQQQQGPAASALASLGALSGLAGLAGGLKTQGDQYVSLMQSATISDRLIDQFDLMKVYDRHFREDARRDLAKNVRVAFGKRDGLVTVQVDDTDPKRAADIANRHVEELRKLTSRLALTEAQQRRMFFESQLTQTRDKLGAAQTALQRSGFNPGALKAEPKSAAEGYARLQAELTSAEIKLQALRRALSDGTPEVQQQLATISALRSQLLKAEAPLDPTDSQDYIGKYREFKYQEILFDLFSRQFELARLDESGEGALMQVIDPATPPERKSHPKRLLTAIGAAVGAFVLLVPFVLLRHAWRESVAGLRPNGRLTRLRAALRQG